MGRTRLLNLRQRETSGVFKPANHTQVGGDGWLVMKSDGSPASEADLAKAGMAACASPDCNLMVPPGASECADGHVQSNFTKGASVDDKQRAEEAEAALAKANERIAELEKAAEAPSATEAPAAAGTDIAKATEGLSPEAKALVESLIAKSEASEKAAADALKKAADLEESKVAGEWLAKAADLVADERAGEFGPILRTVDTVLGPKATETLTQVLKGAAERDKANGLFKAAGVSGAQGAAASAMEEIAARAAELRKANPELTQAAAITKAAELDPDLRARYQNEMRGH